MSPIDVLLLLALAAFLAGIAGSFLGIGGGVFLIPFMTLALGIDIKVAIATSLIGVIATSCGAASVYVRDHLTNLRLAMFLEVATTLGAIVGAVVGLLLPAPYLFGVFAAVVAYAAAAMARTRETAKDRAYQAGEESPLARRLHQGPRDEHAHARADEGRGRHEQLHDRRHGRGERVHLLLPGMGEPELRRDGDRRGLQRLEPRHPRPDPVEGPAGPLRLLDLPRGDWHPHGDPGGRHRGERMMYPRAGLKAVQHRIGALRRAVVAEVEDTNRLIYHVLRGGVVVSVSFILFAFILRGLGGPDIPPNSISVRNLVPELVRFTPAGYLNLGILLMIFTPVARVVLSFLSFAEERDRTYVAVTAIVLLNLLVSVFLLA